ncbi:TPA: LysR family transcriptional regulator [Burkholderia aenigmatica]|uniref:LysR family transcriptional regulator n=1 Tax=Burkholderia sp. AU45251 TaxID=3059204 RepID=UPI00264C7BC1|nr:LysR family transcriptional regulator [Burkholderia sp. AU45251]HDR9482081.1 LysR family transcriptional regulator [Burkholderia aenigmatica]MDN7515284.1 LysR family transcriptional regulator [Burkholderia sp. AU45251]HDR9515548.1 LysR family transcriptional regulator [Burkholderia aenigmatica]HDR9590452.1 LysR family transcriptional regulator [Burkholderia aenigmatica]HDR9598825.1 LysR family transcriptional regulator [Burkholderia aenigmatica]
MNLLEAMRVYVAVVEHGGLSGAASELRLDEAQVSERIDGLERYLGCRLLLCREHDDVACTDAGDAFHVCCRRTLSAVEQAIGAAGPQAADGPDAHDAVHAAARDAVFPPPPGAAHASTQRLSP